MEGNPVVAPATGSRQLRLVADRRLQGSRNAHEAEARVGNDCSYVARFSRSAISCAARTPVLKAPSQVPWPPTLVASPAKYRRSSMAPDGRAGAPAQAGADPGDVCPRLRGPGGRDRADDVLADVVAEDLGDAVDGEVVTAIAPGHALCACPVRAQVPGRCLAAVLQGPGRSSSLQAARR